jgi:1,4-dihydroxy-2-naphthoate octaprenyltransferase
MNVWFLASRPKTLIAAFAPIIMATGWAFHFHSFNWVPCLLCLTFACLVQITTNFANDYYDFTQGIDTVERIGPIRAVASGFVEPYKMLYATALAAGLSLLIGLSLLFYVPWWFLPIGFVSIFLSYAYTASPFSLGYKGWADVLILIFFGIVAVNGAFYAQTGFFRWEVFLSSIAIGLLATNICLVNNYRDYANDQKAGKKTLIVRFGKSFGELEYAFNGVFSFAVCLLLSALNERLGLLLPCLLIIWFVRLVSKLKRAKTSVQFNALLGQTAAFLGMYSLLFSLSLNLGV